MLKKPDVDKIEGLSPAISIEQKTLSKNPRSTVGTTTEIYDYLRLLFAKVGIQYSIEANVPVLKKSFDQILDEILEKFNNQKIQILSPIVKARKGHYRELFEQFSKQGFNRVRVDGEIQEISPGMQLARYKIHDIDLLIDRLEVSEKDSTRLHESLEIALKKGDGIVSVLGSSFDEFKYSIHYTCPISGIAYDKLSPNKFSFNSPYGACPTCDGLGYLSYFDYDLIFDDKNKSIAKGGIPLLDKRNSFAYRYANDYLSHYGFSNETILSEIPEKILIGLLDGDNDLKIQSKYKFSSDNFDYEINYDGLEKIFLHDYENANSTKRKRYEQYMNESFCEDCKGGRLNERSLFVKINNKNIHEITSMNLIDCYDFFKYLGAKFSKNEKKIATPIIKEIKERLDFLISVGLDYLTLGRSSATLSGGEAQRIRLASQIGSKLMGVTYVLDEPSIGLHQHDNYKLINSLKMLRDIGNTLIVVEHDKSMILESDYVIDIGPGAGIHGGEILFSDNIKKLKNSKNSKTSNHIFGNDINITKKEYRKGNGNFIELKGASGNNLKTVNLKIPLGKMVCISGMSGSGKSSLINSTLLPILQRYLNKSNRKSLAYKSIIGLEHVDKVIEINQSPIGRTTRSNPATYTGLFTLIRDFFSLLPESKIRGYTSGRFSFNVSGGRCDDCEGAGLKKIEMNFLPNVYVKCDTCDGNRYNNETLQVKFKGKSIADVLNMTVEESAEFFKEIPKIYNKVKVLNEVGLSYITLGQQAPTLSGGEAQRIKLASELSKRSTGKTIYLLDEPTTGLHFEDILVLQKLLDKLVDKGNTIIIIEHNLDVIKNADWIIDMGPFGGKNGGKIIAQGTPREIIKKKSSLTGKYLKEELLD